MKSLLFPLVALQVFCVSASADIVQVSGVMNVFFGTATSFAAGKPVSQTMGVTAETSLSAGVPADVLNTVLTGP